MRFSTISLVIFLSLLPLHPAGIRSTVAHETPGGAGGSATADRESGYGRERSGAVPPGARGMPDGAEATAYRFTDGEPVLLRMFAPDAVREAVDMTASLEINFSGPRRSSLLVSDLAVTLEGQEIYRAAPGVVYGDGGWYRRLTGLLESMSPVESGISTHRLMVPLEDVRNRQEGEDRDLIRRALDMIDDARSDSYFRDYGTRRLVEIPLPLASAAARVGFEPGRELVVRLVLTVTERYPSRSVARTITLDHPIRILDPFPRDDLRFRDESGGLHRLHVSWHAGDLHVHDCKDEASLFGERGCPDCQAESLNWGDDNTLEDLKEQYMALGADWFTITSHSYCLEQSSEYDEVRAEAQSLSDETFFLIPDTELSSLEEGPQTGTDIGDLICPDGSNHSGAHFIQQHKPGGSDGFLENCNDPIFSFLDNISQIREEGGFGIVNHPNAEAWAWNSVELLEDRYGGGYHGIEIWNGPDGGGQGGYVAFWVDRLLEGGKFYAYSGSDTHDDAFDFGWNHALMTGTPSRAKLKTALMLGRSYISNHQLLASLVSVRGAGLVLMGGAVTVPPGVENVRLFVLSNTGAKTGTVTVFRGVIGAETEEVLGVFDGLTGSRLLQITVPVGTEPFYLRAYSEIPGEGLFAYSNPIWIE